MTKKRHYQLLGYLFLGIMALVAVLTNYENPEIMCLQASQPLQVTPMQSTSPLSGKSVLFIIAPKNFRDEELMQPMRILHGKGAKMTIASTILDTVTGMLGEKVKPDMLLDSVKVDKYDAIIFVGGSGTTVLFDNAQAHRIAKEAKQEKKILGAICLAPAILARAGVLEGCTATAFSSVKDDIEKGGAKYTDKKVATCGKIITAPGPEAVGDFTKAIQTMLETKTKPVQQQ